jgi:hypothetical protein
VPGFVVRQPSTAAAQAMPATSDADGADGFSFPEDQFA